MARGDFFTLLNQSIKHAKNKAVQCLPSFISYSGTHLYTVSRKEAASMGVWGNILGETDHGSLCHHCLVQETLFISIPTEGEPRCFRTKLHSGSM